MEVAAYTRNLVPSVDPDVSPFEKFFEVCPDARNLSVISGAAQVHIPEHKRDSKFERVTEDGILVGYALFS
jgi:hypothetical protein